MLLSINYDSPAELRSFLDERGLGMRKKFGQNFLISPRARSRLIDALEISPGANVWEIGPGLGAMTAELLERGAQVTAFEIDPAFAGVLKELFAARGCSFRLVEGDALKTWPRVQQEEAPSLPEAKEESLFLFGNLPYNIAAALLADFIEKGRFFKRIVVTVQKEVALRMAARPGSENYSSFSVLCSSVYDVKLLHVMKAASFYPAPRVDSQGVRLDFKEGGEKLPKLFYPLVRGLFASRRKTVRNTLTAFAASVIIKERLAETAFPSAKDAAEEAMKRAGILGERRPETLGLEDFSALAASLESIAFNGNR